jgi:beta-glucan synthesis-associated protein KRE6
MLLVFSDEFNTDGRSFYPGDDPYWEAGDMHYWVCIKLHLLEPIDIFPTRLLTI